MGRAIYALAVASALSVFIGAACGGEGGEAAAEPTGINVLRLI
jgi:hypothetical protein